MNSFSVFSSNGLFRRGNGGRRRGGEVVGIVGALFGIGGAFLADFDLGGDDAIGAALTGSVRLLIESYVIFGYFSCSGSGV